MQGIVLQSIDNSMLAFRVSNVILSKDFNEKDLRAKSKNEEEICQQTFFFPECTYVFRNKVPGREGV